MIRVLLFCLMIAVIEAKTVYFVNVDPAQIESQFYNPEGWRDGTSKPFCFLRETLENEGFEVKFSEHGKKISDAYAVISIGGVSKKILNNLSKLPSARCFMIAFEPPVVIPKMYDSSLKRVYGKIFVMFDDLVDNTHYFKFYYPQPSLELIDPLPTFSEKKFCALIAGNKDFKHPKALYKERRKVISFYTKLNTKELDLFGTGWNGHSLWQGPVDSKLETLKNYKFCYCYENMKDQEGYITEKIFDCLIAGCIPIYWGADNIAAYVPTNCFIDRKQFDSDEQLYQFLKNMPEETYESYISSIKDYLSKDHVKLFSTENFCQIVLSHILSLK